MNEQKNLSASDQLGAVFLGVMIGVLYVVILVAIHNATSGEYDSFFDADSIPISLTDSRLIIDTRTEIGKPFVDNNEDGWYCNLENELCTKEPRVLYYEEVSEQWTEQECFELLDQLRYASDKMGLNEPIQESELNPYDLSMFIRLNQDYVDNC